MTEADLVRVQQLLELMFVGGLRFDADGRVINATRWDYETSIFVSIELLATVGRPTVCHSVESTIVSENIRFMRIFAGVNSLGRGRQFPSNHIGGCRRRPFLAILVATSSKTSHIRQAILYDDMLPVVDRQMIAK